MSIIKEMCVFDMDPCLRVRPINDDIVSEYIAAMQDGAEFPPVLVAFDKDAHKRDPDDDEPGEYFLIDGHHRGMASITVSSGMVKAEIVDMTKEEALWLALGANAKNGHRLAGTDLEGVIRKALESFPNVSTRELAKHIGCSHTTIVNYNKKLRQSATSVVNQFTTESDGEEPPRRVGGT